MIKDVITCPGCGIKLNSEKQGFDHVFNASIACRELYHELSHYSLSLHDSSFIHQLIVDTYCAQHFGKHVKPISITFALVGLYLVCEKNYSGKQVQGIHALLANRNKSKHWPAFEMPKEKALLTIQNVIFVSDEAKDDMIKKWCCSVWSIWKTEKETLSQLIATYQELQ